MATNYYVILGIRSDATPDEIKSAYRREARKHHPDCSGEGSEPFLRVRDAYEVLSDPRQRRAHDEELARERRREQRATRQPAEPLRPQQRASYGQPPLSSLFDELFGRPWDDAAAWSPLRSQPWPPAREIHAEVTLTRRQAGQGGRVRIWLPVQVTCPACQGWGGDGWFECQACYGRGTLADERPVDVAFPAGVHDRLIGSVSVRLPGGHELSLVLHFRVDDW